MDLHGPMFGAVAAELARVADALEKSANGGPKEDSEARSAIRVLAARLAELEKGNDSSLLKRALEAEARIEKLERDLRSLRGKVYRDPEYHQPAQRAAAAPSQVFEIGGATPLVGEEGETS